MAERAATYTVRGPLIELTCARVRELTREPEAVFWVFVFPDRARGDPRSGLPQPAARGAAGGGGRRPARRGAAGRACRLEPISKPSDPAGGGSRARRSPAAASCWSSRPATRPTYAYDPTQPESRAARLAVDAALQRAAGRADAFTAARARGHRAGRALRRLPGAGPARHEPHGHGMWGIGFSLVVARNGNLLKRLVAAPVAPQPSARRAAHVAADLPGPRSRGAAAVRLLRARRADARLAVPARRRVAARRAGVQRPGPADRGASAHHRGRLRRHEPGDGADVGVLRDLLLDRALPGGACSRSSRRCR